MLQMSVRKCSQYNGRVFMYRWRSSSDFLTPTVL
jgi:hypothetical protein